MALSEEKLCSVGCKWMYTFNCLEAKKFIPVTTLLSEFHDYKFVWDGTLITFYIDNDEIETHIMNVPPFPPSAYFMITYFGRDFINFGGPATSGTRHFFVDRASYTPLNPGPPNNSLGQGNQGQGPGNGIGGGQGNPPENPGPPNNSPGRGRRGET